MSQHFLTFSAGSETVLLDIRRLMYAERDVNIVTLWVVGMDPQVLTLADAQSAEAVMTVLSSACGAQLGGVAP